MFYDDLGLYYLKNGFGKNENGDKILHYFYDVAFDNVIQINENLFTTCANTHSNGKIYAVSFDYCTQILLQISKISGIDNLLRFYNLLNSSSIIVKIPVIVATLGGLQTNSDESYVPLSLKKIWKKNDSKPFK